MYRTKLKVGPNCNKTFSTVTIRQHDSIQLAFWHLAIPFSNPINFNIKKSTKASIPDITYSVTYQYTYVAVHSAGVDSV